MSLLYFNLFVLFISCCVVLLSCADETFSSKHVNIESSISDSQIGKNDSLKYGKFARNVRIENAWSVPELLNVISLDDFATSEFIGPLTKLSNSGSSLIAWQTNEVSISTNKIVSMANLLYRNQELSPWNNVNLDFITSGKMTFPEFYLLPNSDSIYFVYGVDNGISFNIRNPNTGIDFSWFENLAVDVIQKRPGLIVDSVGNADVYWVSKNSGDGYKINTMHYEINSFSSDPVGKIVSLIQRANSTEKLSVVKILVSPIGDNNLLFVWQENKIDTVSNESSISLLSSIYNLQTGWQEIVPVTSLLSTPSFQKISLVSSNNSTNAKLVVIYQHVDQVQSVMKEFSLQNGTWIGKNIFDAAALTMQKSFDIKANAAGEVVVAWSELLMDTQVFMNQISVILFNQAQGWSREKFILSDTIPFIPSSTGIDDLPFDKPSVSLNNKGNIAVTWIDVSSDKSNIFTSQFTPGSGWATQQLVSEAQNPKIQSVSTHLNANNTNTIVWTELMPVLNGGEIKLYSSVYNQSGNPVQPPPVNVADPVKPPSYLPSGHELITSNCHSCHNGVQSNGKHSSHLITTNICEACHFTIGWVPFMNIDHKNVVGSCFDCHNNINATGKPMSHFLTSDICVNCHSADIWLPVNAVDHSQVIGSCSSCHNGNLASSKNQTHIATNQECDYCHSIGVWIPTLIIPNPQQLP